MGLVAEIDRPGSPETDPLSDFSAPLEGASSPAASPARLARLASHPSPEVRAAVAAHPAAPPATLARLARDGKDSVLIAVASNPAADRKTVMALLRSARLPVRYVAVSHPNVGIYELLRLALSASKGELSLARIALRSRLTGIFSWELSGPVHSGLLDEGLDFVGASKLLEKTVRLFDAATPASRLALSHLCDTLEPGYSWPAVLVAWGDLTAAKASSKVEALS